MISGHKKSKLTYLTSLLDVIIGSVLIYSSLLHMGNAYQFLESLTNYDLTSPSLSTIATVLLIQAMFLTGANLVFGNLRTGSQVAAAVLFVIFLFAQLHVYHSGEVVGCGCFGVETEPVGIYSITRAAFLLLMTACSIGFTVLHASGTSDELISEKV